MSNRLTEEEKKFIVKEKLLGVPSRKIAKELNRGKSSINEYYNKYLNLSSDKVEDAFDGIDLEKLCEHTDVSISNLAKRLRTAQKTNNQLRKIQNSLFDGGDVSNAHLEAVASAVSTLEVNTYIPKPQVKTGSEAATVEILFSDLQIGKVGEKYNTEKAIEALKDYGEQLVEYILNQSNSYDIERIIFASLGDIVEDHLKHGVQSACSTDSGLSEQMANAIKYIWKYVLNPIFNLGIKTDVMCIAGNHGSSQHKGMDMFKAGLFSYDYTIYNALKLITKTAKFDHVSFIIPEGVFGYLNIYGNYSVYEHGYFNTATEKSMSDQMKKRGQQIKKHVEYFRCGDMHHTCSYDTHRIILNGAFFGVDEGGIEYSGILGFSSIPSQVVVLHTQEERLGRTTAKDYHLIQLA